MAELQHVFISYSRLDDAPIGASSVGWVTKFSKDLNAALPMVYGKEVAIWLDRKRLRGNSYFAEAIDDASSNSAILIPIISPPYIEDAHGWLARERETFINSTMFPGGVRLGNLSRICPIERRKVNRSSLPSELKGINIIHRFYDAEGDSLADLQYEGEVFRVAQTVADMLVNLTGFSKGWTKTVRSFKKIYLAKSTPDLDFERKNIELELKRFGYLVSTPDSNSNPAELRTRNANEMSECGVSIHLVGGNLDSAPQNDRSSIVAQADLASEQIDDGLVKIVWTPPHIDLNILSSQQSSQVGYFYSSLTAPCGYEYSRQPFEKFLGFVLDKLKALEKDSTTPKTEIIEEFSPGVMRKAYFVCDPKDRHILEPIQKELQAYDWWVEFPPETDDESTFRKLHEMHLRDCQAFVIYFGATEKEWVDVQRLDYRMANLPYRRLAPLFSKWIYCGPQENDAKKAYGPKEDYSIEGDYVHPFTNEFVEHLVAARPRAKKVQTSSAA